jgi:AraC-like DNA-binding protein
MVDDILFDMTSSILSAPMAEHAHNCIEITITCGGNATHIAGGMTEHLQRGDVFIILPGCSHSLKDCRKFDHINISCSTDIFARVGINLAFIHGVKDLFVNSRKLTSFHLNNKEFIDAKHLLYTMLEAYLKNKKEEKGNLRAYFAMLICLLAQSYSLHHNSDIASGRLDKVLNYVNEHFREKISLPEIANIANLSVSQLVRIFKKNYGMTPVDYIIELRLNEARRLLGNTTLAVSEIADITGFNDSNYFSRAFRKRFGITPIKSR